jgi:hypothetical protein
MAGFGWDGMVNISGATASTYRVTEGYENHQLRVVATSNDSGGTTASSSATSPIGDVTPTLSVAVTGTAREEH